MTEQELNFYKKQEEEAKNKLWKIACEYGAESHGRKPYIFWEEVAKIVKENRHLFLEEYDEDGTAFNLSSLLLQKLEGKVLVENYGQEKPKDTIKVLNEIISEIKKAPKRYPYNDNINNCLTEADILDIINNKIEEIKMTNG